MHHDFYVSISDLLSMSILLRYCCFSQDGLWNTYYTTYSYEFDTGPCDVCWSKINHTCYIGILLGQLSQLLLLQKEKGKLIHFTLSHSAIQSFLEQHTGQWPNTQLSGRQHASLIGTVYLHGWFVQDLDAGHDHFDRKQKTACQSQILCWKSKFYRTGTLMG